MSKIIKRKTMKQNESDMKSQKNEVCKKTVTKRPSKIEWCEETLNIATGCDKISEACEHCYMFNMSPRLKGIYNSGIENGWQNGAKFTLHPERIDIPLGIKRKTMFFVNSMSDTFHEDMPFEFLDRFFEMVKQTPHHTYQLLTKRSAIMAKYFATREVPDNVWLGVTVENAKNKYRIDDLCQVNAKIKFLSIEPLLGDLGELNLEGIHWAILGGESGNKARPMKEEWAVNVQQQCKNKGVAFLFKQWGNWSADGVKKRNKHDNGRLLKGVLYDEYPAVRYNK